MARFSLQIKTSATASGVAVWELFASASVRACLNEFGVFLNTAVASTMVLARPSAVGITPTAVALELEDPNSFTPATQMAITWGTAPTLGTKAFRGLEFPATVGSALIILWPDWELVIPKAASIAFFNGGAGACGLHRLWAAIRE